MLRGIRFNDYDDAARIAKASGVGFNPVVDQCISRIGPSGALLGGIIYSQWTGVGGSLTMHVAAFADRWINRELLWIAFDYPFNQLGVKKVFGQVPAYNKVALNFDLNLGFQEEAVIRDVYPDGDMVLLSMTREQCRFLNLMPRELRN